MAEANISQVPTENPTVQPTIQPKPQNKNAPPIEDTDLGDLDELFEAFSLFDKDCNGVISRDEIGLIMRSIGLNPINSEIEEMINEAETDLHSHKVRENIEIDKIEQLKEEKVEKQKLLEKKMKHPSGLIDFPEFIAFLSRKSITTSDLHKVYADFTTDKEKTKQSKPITSELLLRILGDLGEPVNEQIYKETVERLIKESDTDGDGEINEDEFIAMMNAK